MERNAEILKAYARDDKWTVRNMIDCQSLLESLDTKNVLAYPDSGGLKTRRRTVFRPATHKTTISSCNGCDVTVMPGSDIAIMAKRREYGEAYMCGAFWEIHKRFNQHITGQTPNTDTPAEDAGEKPVENTVSKCERRAKRQVRRICNASQCTYMWTLTFAPKSEENSQRYECIPIELQRDRGSVMKLWKAFLKRFYRRGIKFQWVLVLELHDSDKTSVEKRGTWHLHFATPTRLDAAFVWASWKHGTVDVRDFTKPVKTKKGQVVIDNPGGYISKYIGKSFSVDNAHVKRYTCSRNITRPIKLSLEEFVAATKGRFFQELWRIDMKDAEGRRYGVSAIVKEVSVNEDVHGTANKKCA
jgi:hypothetical protein